MPRRSWLRLTGTCWLTACCALAAPPPPAADARLDVDSVAGAALRNRLGETSALHTGDELDERDVAVVAPGGRLSLSDGANGQFELGADTELAVENLPPLAEARDLNTILDLRRGFLRVVWNPPPGRPAPLYVFFGRQYAALGAGEYFFDSRDIAARACVVAGHLGVIAASAVKVQPLGASACYRFIGGLPPQQSPRDAASWAQVRANLSLDAPDSPEAQLAQRDAEAAAPAAAKPPGGEHPPPALPAAPAAAAALAPPATPAEAAFPAGWAVNVGAFADVAQARKLSERLHAGGFPAALEPVQLHGQTLWRVRLHGYRDAEAGKAAAALLGQRYELKNLWVVQEAAAVKH